MQTDPDQTPQNAASGHVGCLFKVQRLFQLVFQSMSSHLSERRRKQREIIGERENIQTIPTAPYTSTVGPCPTRPGTESYPASSSDRNHPTVLTVCQIFENIILLKFDPILLIFGMSMPLL